MPATIQSTKIRRRVVNPSEGGVTPSVTDIARPAAGPVAGNPLDSTEHPGQVRWLKGVLFGPPKTGKTVAACSGRGRKLLVLMEPEGDLSLVGREDVDVIRPANWKELNDIIAGLFTTHRGRWDTVVFDSVTFMFELIGAKDILSAAAANKDVRRQYLNAGAAVNQLIYDAVRLPMNVIFTCQLKVDTPDDEAGETPLDPTVGEYNWTLALTPMVFKVLSPAVSFIGRTFKKFGYAGETVKHRVAEYWVSFEDFGKSPAGARIPVPEQVKNLNMDELLAAVQDNGRSA